MTEFRYTLYRDEEEILVSVLGEYVPAERGARGSLYEPEEPDYPADFEIDEVTRLETGEAIEITDEETAEVVRAGVEAAEEGCVLMEDYE